MSAIAVHRFPPAYGATPRLVEVEAEDVLVDGVPMWTLHRPGEHPDDGVIVSAEGIAVVGFFDGTRDLRGIQRAVFEQYGQLLYIERIHELAIALSRARLLTTAPAEPGTKPFVNPAGAPTLHLPTQNLRPPAHAGAAYPADPAELARTLDRYFAHPEGPGGPPVPVPDGARLLGLVVPHIDLDRGGPTYAHGYRALAERSDADLFVVLGTAHASPAGLFTLTRRHYDTPFGPVPTDHAALAILESELGDTIFRDEAVHDEEHSIEFQAVYLRYLFPTRRITLLPVLCSSLYGIANANLGPRDEPAVERFLAALMMATEGRRVTYIAAADLSHVGRLYGDEAAPSAERLQEIERRDRESLYYLREGDADGFFDDVVPDEHTRRICGLTPIYALVRATGGSPAKLVKYAQWVGSEEESAVTFAAVTIDAL